MFDFMWFYVTYCLVHLSHKHFMRACSVAKSCPILCDSMDWSLPGSSVHGISQTTILEWIAISFSRGSSWPRDRTHVSCIGRQILYQPPVTLEDWMEQRRAEQCSSSNCLPDPKFPSGKRSLLGEELPWEGPSLHWESGILQLVWCRGWSQGRSVCKPGPGGFRKRRNKVAGTLSWRVGEETSVEITGSRMLWWSPVMSVAWWVFRDKEALSWSQEASWFLELAGGWGGDVQGAVNQSMAPCVTQFEETESSRCSGCGFWQQSCHLPTPGGVGMGQAHGNTPKWLRDTSQLNQNSY